MKVKSIVKAIALIAFFIFIFKFDLSVNSVSGEDCENTPESNQAIVDSVYEKIKANKSLAGQISHINVTSTNLAVKIEGWADSKKDYDKVVEYALAAPCARVVNVNNFQEEKPSENLMPSSCAPGTKQCGDICIPDNDICSIKGR
jgi:hypothetical protein